MLKIENLLVSHATAQFSFVSVKHSKYFYENGNFNRKAMKWILNITFICLMAISQLPAQGQKSTDILGKWISEGGRSHVEIYQKNTGGAFFGKIIWLKEPKDENGKPKLADNGEPVLGMEFMRNFVFDDDEWEDGEIYDPESGKTYYSSMELDDINTLDLRGSVDPMGWIGRTQTWKRLE